MNLMVYWSYIFIIPAALSVPGYFIARRLKILCPLQQISVSFGISFLIILLLMPLCAFKLLFLVRILFIGIFVFSLWQLVKRRHDFIYDNDTGFLVLTFFAGILVRYFLQTLWEYPVIGGDWFYHAFRIPYAFTEGNWAPPEERPPLFNLIIHFYHNLIGTTLYKYWISQVISVILNSIYIFPMYFIAKKVFGEWVAKISVLFTIVNPFLIFNTIYTWPKNAAMYGILMMIYFLFFSENNIRLRYMLAGLFAGISYWFHNYSMFYIGVAVLLLFFRRKVYKCNFSRKYFRNLREISYFFIILVVVLTPYFIWQYRCYGTVFTSKFMYYPIAVGGYEDAFQRTPEELWEIFSATPIIKIVAIRVINAIVTLTPAVVSINPFLVCRRTYNSIFYYSHDYPGGLTFIMYLLVLLWFAKYILRKTKTDSTLVCFLIPPFFINLIIYGWTVWGLVNQMLNPTVPILIMIGINELNNFKRRFRSILLFMLFVVAIAEDYIYAVLIKKFYVVEGGINSVIEAGKEVFNGFNISNFISAHFLLNDSISFCGNSILLLMLFFCSIYLILDRK